MNSDKRRARVKRLKYEILCFMCLMVVVPWALTILLAARNHALKADAEKKEASAAETAKPADIKTEADQKAEKDAKIDALLDEIAEKDHSEKE